MNALLNYVGGKHRIAARLGVYLHNTGADTLVDVFAGSAAVILNAGFKKNIYNDISGDLVCFFTTIAYPPSRVQLYRRLKYMPASRQIFDELYTGYRANCFSFSYLPPIERAAAVFYRHQFAFGGKVRSGGFQVTTAKDREGIKEIVRYRNNLRRIIRLGKLFETVMIENLHYQECISLYGKKTNHVLFIDPPYVETEHYYSGQRFRTADHVFLAHQLRDVKASVVCTYYDNPVVRELYPESNWRWEHIESIKNSSSTIPGHKKEIARECVLIKKD